MEYQITEPKDWIHDLARAELNPELGRMLEAKDAYDTQQLIEDATALFLKDLRSRLTEFSKVFNSYSEAGQRFSEVKVYGMADSSADFMVFRNQVKLVVSNCAHGVIRISFEKHSPGAVRVSGRAEVGAGTGQDSERGQDLVAEVGPFRDVYWVFQNQKVNPEQVAKFYFNEFVRTTRVQSRGKLGDQELLSQFKVFLQQRGLDV